MEVRSSVPSALVTSSIPYRYTAFRRTIPETRIHFCPGGQNAISMSAPNERLAAAKTYMPCSLTLMVTPSMRDPLVRIRTGTAIHCRCDRRGTFEERNRMHRNCTERLFAREDHRSTRGRRQSDNGATR